MSTRSDMGCTGLLKGSVYPLVGGHVRTGRNAVDSAKLLVDAGARLLQVREKDVSDADLHRSLQKIRTICSRAGALMIVNDRVDLALAIGAEGVHLGQDDMPVDAARRLMGRQALIGLSTHNRMQFVRAQEAPIDYVALGPIYQSRSKAGAHAPLGERTFAELATTSRLPVVAIGGIDLGRARRLWKLGATAVAVIADIVGHGDPGRRLREYLKAGAESRNQGV